MPVALLNGNYIINFQTKFFLAPDLLPLLQVLDPLNKTSFTKVFYFVFTFFCLRWSPYSIEQQCCSEVNECEVLVNWKVISFDS